MRKSYEVLVVGSGVIGASIAFHLSKHGCTNVALLEREAQIACGATARSSAVIRTHYSIPSNARLAARSTEILMHFAEYLGDEEADAGFRRSGYLILAAEEDVAERVKQNIAMQRSLGIRVEYLDATQARELHPFLNCEDIAVIGFEPDSGYADPYLTATGFAQAARRNGVELITSTPVTGITRTGERITGVKTTRGDFQAGCIVFALNVWSGLVAGWLGVELPLDVSKHRLVVYKVDLPYPLSLPVVKDMTSVEKLYYRPDTSGGVLVGAGDHGESVGDPDCWDETVDTDYVLATAELLQKRMPAFAQAVVVKTWAGLYDVTPDWNPVLGPVPGLQGVHLAYGFSGHGFKLSPAVGDLMARSILGLESDIDIALYSLARFARGERLVGKFGAGSIA
jgi:glycine/D-amino acid oxidase-like deaminating enzyme